MSIKSLFFCFVLFGMSGCGKRTQLPKQKMVAECWKQLKRLKCPVRRADARNNYACALAGAGQEENAFNIWKELLCDPAYLTPEVAHYNVAKYFLQQQELKKAFACLSRALECEPQFIDARFLYAAVCRVLGRRLEARIQLARILRYEPKHEGARELLRLCGVAPQILKNPISPPQSWVRVPAP